MKSNSWSYAPNPRGSKTHGELGTYLFGGWYWDVSGKKTNVKSLKNILKQKSTNKTSYVLPCYFWVHHKNGAEKSFPAVSVPTNLAVTRIAKPPWNRLRAVAHVAWVHQKCLFRDTLWFIWGVPEMVVPNNHGFSVFLIKMIILGCSGGITI